MTILFIDANILLRFYDSNANDFRCLLSTLQDVREHLFITAQVTDEVRRNRVRVLRNSLNSYRALAKHQTARLPEHFDQDNPGRARSWNESWKKTQTSISKLHDELDNYGKELLAKVGKSEDSVSALLDSIFEGAQKPTATELQAAEKRKKLGNPPGKHCDPIGDELTWEQILNRYDGSQELWIVSADSDFYDTFQGEYILNAHLRAELNAKAGAHPSQVRIFDKLSDALNTFRKDGIADMPKLPNESVVDRIRGEEAKLATVIFDADPPQPCPACGPAARWSGPTALRSRYGGLTMQYVCNSCGLHYDTGDFWD